MIDDHSMFDQICDFKVECFDPGLSDVHCALYCEIKLFRSSSSIFFNEVEPLVKKSGMKINECFGRAICTSEVLRLNQYLFRIIANLFDISSSYRNVEMRDIILRAAEIAGGTLECIGKLNLLKAQLCAFNTSDSTTIPLTMQNWQITSYDPDSTDFVVDSSNKCLAVRTVGMPLCPGFHKNICFAK